MAEWQKLDPKYKIMIVDDSPDIHELIRISFRKFDDIKLIHCLDPKGVETLLMNEQPRMILLDIQMPCISGDQLFLQLRQKDLLKNTDVIFLTGMDTPEDLKRLGDLHPQGIMRKSFSPKSIAQQVHDILESKAV